MNGFVSDHDIEGHFLRLIQMAEQSFLAEEWHSLHLRTFTFAALGWSITLPDSEVWRRCQERELVLVTNNRNREDESSLEATLRISAGDWSLPVVTIGSVERFRNEREYAAKVVEEFVEFTYDLVVEDRWRGAGRVYVPRRRPQT